MIHLHSSEKKTLLWVCLLLVAISGLTYWWFYMSAEAPTEVYQLTEAERKQIEALEKEEPKGKTNRKEASRPFPFDPNHADSATLVEVGLKPWQVRNLMKYRRKGGRWRSAEDFKRLYGLSEETYTRLKPYIRIAPEDAAPSRYDQENKHLAGNKEKEERREDIPEHWVKKTDKYEEGTILPINTADTTQLKHIPGIGSYYAKKIVRYREALGGFTHLGQIEEIEGLPSGISRWFSIAPDAKPQRRNLNRCSFKELVRHPYLSYEQVKDIFDHKRHYGPIRSWEDLRLFPHFKETDFERLKPYFTLE